MRDFCFPEERRRGDMKKEQEGAVYKQLTVFDKAFEIRYGYYEDFERHSEHCDPVPIYPDFRENPLYTRDGYPFVTKMQELCQYGSSRFSDGCCADCPHYLHGDEMIGICTCKQNRRSSQ